MVVGMARPSESGHDLHTPQHANVSTFGVLVGDLVVYIDPAVLQDTVHYGTSHIYTSALTFDVAAALICQLSHLLVAEIGAARGHLLVAEIGAYWVSSCCQSCSQLLVAGRVQASVLMTHRHVTSLVVCDCMHTLLLIAKRGSTVHQQT